MPLPLDTTKTSSSDADDAERRGMKDTYGAEGTDDVSGAAGARDVGRDAGENDSAVTSTAKDQVFFVPMYLNRGCCGCRRGCRSSLLSP